MINIENLPPYFAPLMLALSVWDIIWRAQALWRAARNNHLRWFIALMVVNSVGILPIIYLKFFGKAEKIFPSGTKV